MLKRSKEKLRMHDIVLTVEPFSEEEEHILNLLMCTESDGHSVRYEVVNIYEGDGKYEHKYILNGRDGLLYDVHSKELS